jgi:hypothetical protein
MHHTGDKGSHRCRSCGAAKEIVRDGRIPLAEIVIEEFGGVCKAAKALGLEPTDVSKWRAPKEKRGCGGDVPSRLKPKILELAQAQGLNITAEDLVNGYRKVSA